MHKDNISRMVSVGRDVLATALPESGSVKFLPKLAQVIQATLVNRVYKPDFTYADWRRVEFGEKLVPCPHRDSINQYQWRI